MTPGKVLWAGLAAMSLGLLVFVVLQHEPNVASPSASGAVDAGESALRTVPTPGALQGPGRTDTTPTAPAVVPAPTVPGGQAASQPAAPGDIVTGTPSSPAVRLPAEFALPPHRDGSQVMAYRESDPHGNRFRREYILRDDAFKYPVRVAEDCERQATGAVVVLQREECVADQVIAKLNPEQDRQAFEAMLTRLGLAVKRELDRDGMLLLRAPDVSLDSVPSAQAQLAANASCEFVEPDFIVHTGATPNDPSYGSGDLWAMAKISAPTAWDVRHDASGVVVAVIDTGVRCTHEDLATNLWRNPGEIAGNGRDDDGNGYADDVYGIDAYNGDSNPMDDNGHGTHVAGTIGAVGNNGKGVVGAAWNVGIMALKFQNSRGSGAASDAITCINYAVENGADILSNSWGGGPSSAALESAIIAARNAGVIFVAAAGNDGDNTDTDRHYPSSYTQDNIVSVAATTQSDGLASFSNYGATSVDIAAPGVDIYSTYYSSDTSYTSLDGTSMATPLVAGCLAILKAQFPHEEYLSLIGRLYAGGDTVAGLSGKVKTGKRVNLNGALLGILSPPTGVTASDGTYADRVAVSWNSVWGATYYRVSRGTSVDGPKTALGTWQSGTTYSDISAVAGTIHYYWVQAATSASGADASALSAYDMGRLRAPYPDAWDPSDDTPAGATVLAVAATPTTHGPHGLNADDVYDLFCIDMTTGRSYVFESMGGSDTYGELYSSSSLGTRVAYDNDAGTDSNFRIAYTPATVGTYYLRVRGYTVGAAASYALSCWYELAPLTAPTGVAASDGSYPDKVRVSWNSVAGASHYRVYRATSSGGAKTELGDGWQVATSYDDRTATPGTTCYYWVKAAASADGASASAFSAYDTGYCIVPLTATLSDISWADAVDGDGDGYTRSRTFLFSVTCSRNASLTLKFLYRAAGAASWSTYLTANLSASADVNPVRWANTGASPELTHGAYDWKIEAYEGSGLVASELGLGVLTGQFFETAAQDMLPLAGPTGVNASDGLYPNRVTITWNSVAGATHYQVWRATGMDGVKTALTGWQTVGYCHDTTAGVGTTYDYWVQAAADAMGNRASDYGGPDTGYVSADSLGVPRVLRQFGYGSLYCVAYSPDGTMFLTGEGAGTATLFDLGTGTQLQTFSGHTDSVQSVAFSPDGTRVLTGSADTTAKLWDAASGVLLRTFSGHTMEVNSVAFSSDGTRVLTVSWDSTAKLWDVARGALLRTFNTVISAALSQDGTRVLTGSWDNTAKLWDAASGALLQTFSGHTGSVRSVAFSPDGTRVLTGSYDNTAKLWDAASGALLRTFSGHTGSVWSVAFSPDGTRVLTGSSDHLAVLWDVASGALLRTFSGHTDSVRSVAFSPDGTRVLTGSYDNTAKLWDVVSGALLRTFSGHTWSVESVSFSPDGTRVLTGSYDKTAKLWDAASGALLRTFSGHTDSVRSVAFSPDGTRVLTGSSDNFAVLWDVASGALLRTFSGHTDGVMSVSFSPDGTRVLTGSSDNLAVLWDMASGSLRGTFSGHTDYVHSVAFSPDGTQVLTGSWDNFAVLWDVASGALLRTFSGHTDGVMSVAFSPDGTRVLTGSSDKTAKLWDTASGSLLRTFSGHASSVYSVAFSPDGTRVLTGSGDGVSRLWALVTDTDFNTLRVTAGSGSGKYIESEFVTVWANAAPTGKSFVRWEGDTEHLEVATAVATRVTMPDRDIAVTAIYEGPKYPLEVVRGSGDGDYESGSLVTVTADPPPAGLEFAAWTGDVAGLTDAQAAETMLRMPSHALAITATYRVPTYTLTVTDGTGGGDYEEGATVAVAANAPPPGERFAAWVGDVGAVADVRAASTSLTMPAVNITVAATYRGYDLTVNNGSGDGNYPAGRTVAITADTPPEGQVFDRWTGDVGGVAEVTFEATTLAMPAADIVVAATYRPAPAPDPFGEPQMYPTDTMRIVASVVLFGNPATRDGSVAVYCGDELRGKAMLTLRQGIAFADLTAYTPQAGETLSFKVWDASAETAHEARYSFAQSAPGTTLGSYPDDLFLVEVTNEVILDLPLKAGWNHISANVELPDPSPRRAFAPVLGDLGRVVHDADSFDPDRPDAQNSLTEIAGGKGYWVKMNVAATLSVRGLPLVVADVTVPLSPGWNSVGYVPQQAGSIREVLADLLESGAVERITGDSGVFHPDLPDSLNSLTTMRPGSGYWLKVTTNATLRYAEPGGGISSLTLSDRSGDTDPFGDPVATMNPPMSILTTVTLSGQPAGLGDVVAAYCGDELRGKQPVSLVDGNTFVNLAVNVAQNGEPITFRLWDYSADRVYRATSPALTAEIGGAFGSFESPHELAFGVWLVSLVAVDHGTLMGDSAQWVNDGGSTTPVTAVPDFGYVFERWSDGRTDNPRTVADVSADMPLTASFRVAVDSVPPDGGFLARVDATAAASRGLWDLTGPYAASAKSNRLALTLLHDATGRLGGTATYTIAPDTVVTMPIRGSVKGNRGSLTMKGALNGADSTKTVTVSLSLNLTVDTAQHELTGRLTGRVRSNGTTTLVDDPVVFELPERMNGSWTLSFALDQSGRTVTGTAELRLSNEVKHSFVVRGRTGANNKAALTLAGDPANPASKAISIRTTLTPLEGGWATLESFSGKGYGQVVGW